MIENVTNGLASRFLRIILAALLLILCCSNLTLGIIHIYKTSHSNIKNNNEPNLVKTIKDESIWLNINYLKLKNPTSYQIAPHHEIISKGLVQYYGPSHCYSKIKSVKSKIPCLLLLSGDTTVCDIHRKILITQNAGYAGLILHSTDETINSIKIADLGPNAVDYRIPVFFINYDDGLYLKEIFSNDDSHEISHFIKIEKPPDSWPSRTIALYFRSVFHKSFIFIIEVLFAFVTVIAELLLAWFNTAYAVVDKTGFLSLLIICLPIIVLVVAALVAEARTTSHPFFGDHFSGQYYQHQGPSYSDYFPEDEYEQNDETRRQGPPINEETLKFYRTLGISPRSTFENARAVYLNLCRQLHSDVMNTEGMSEGEIKRNEDRMKEVTAAWRGLKIYWEPSNED